MVSGFGVGRGTLADLRMGMHASNTPHSEAVAVVLARAHPLA